MSFRFLFKGIQHPVPVAGRAVHVQAEGNQPVRCTHRSLELIPYQCMNFRRTEAGENGEDIIIDLASSYRKALLPERVAPAFREMFRGPDLPEAVLVLFGKGFQDPLTDIEEGLVPVGPCPVRGRFKNSDELPNGLAGFVFAFAARSNGGRFGRQPRADRLGCL